jgi:phosphoadenosine phosphosulfate reductase
MSIERGKEKWATSGLEEKIEGGKQVVREALQRSERPVLLYTGGKDSTVVLWLVEQAIGSPVPFPLLILDHGLHFPETWEFIEEAKKNQGFEILIARNEDVISNARDLNSPITILNLNEENQNEIRENLKNADDSFPFSLDSDVGNHLLKTVAMKQALRQYGFDYAFVGIRWDEHPARANEDFFSPRQNPEHMRVHPILPFGERDIWDVMLNEKLPIHPLYEEGYRSLDSIGAEPLDRRAAWEQELGVNERAGREQDKEELMERLRALGYM